MNLFPINESWEDFPIILKKLLSDLGDDGIIVEIGGGANPILIKTLVGKRNYIVIDIDEEELEKSSDCHFTKIKADITKKSLDIKADLIISHMLLEHIPNPKEFHNACHNLLKPEGKVVHFYATLFSPASSVNLILPDSWSNWLLHKIQKRKWETEGKFPAYYNWCLGPVKKQYSRLKICGF